MSAAPAAKTCAAAEQDGVMACARCGFEWPCGEMPPLCDPITFVHLSQRMIEECARAEASLLSVMGLSRGGVATDGGARARRRLAELNAILRLVERCAGDGAIKAILNGKK